jgi:hypothetical protein
MAKPKPVNYDVIEDDDKRPHEAYRLLGQVRTKWHPDMEDARIALAWRKRQKADKDGHLVLGRCVKISDLQKEFMPFDFVIVLNREVWEDSEFTKEKKLALLDHEMCHATPLLDESTGEHKSDEKERLCYRTRNTILRSFERLWSATDATRPI